MKKLSSFLFLLLLTVCMFAQNVVVTFTGRDTGNHFIPLSRVVITDITQNWQETIYYPDTVYNMSLVGIDERDADFQFALSNNMPNPFEGTSAFKLQLPESGKVYIEINDLTGRRIATYERELPAGSHLFRTQLSSPQNYLLTARCGKYSASLKLMNTGSADGDQIKYLGESVNKEISLELNNDSKDDVHPFNIGDQMEYIGYAVVDGVEYQSQTIQQQQIVSEDFIFNFQIQSGGGASTDFTCGISTVSDHEGNVYNTVQIGNQCWTKENMRCMTSPSTGTTILEASPSSYSYTGKKAYYVNGSADSTATYGLLYNWCAAVDTFNTTYGETSTETSSSFAPEAYFSGNRRGICPAGWHVPSNADWIQLINYVSSQSSYQCGSISTNIAKALASTNGWHSYSLLNDCAVSNTPANNNATGFSAVPAGYYHFGYCDPGAAVYFWSATQDHVSYAYVRYLSCYSAIVQGYSYTTNYGYSVRCLRD